MEQGVLLHLPKSKTDQFGIGHDIQLSPSGTPATPFERSNHSSSATPNHPQTRYSQHPVAPLIRNGLWTNLQRHSSKPALTPRHILVTHSVMVQPTLPSQQEYLGTRSKEWVVGNQQWIDISRSQQCRLNSFPPTGAFTWPPRVRRASSDSLPTVAVDRTEPRNSRTPGLAFQRGCLTIII
jgi:hypothetical protein